MTGVVEWKGLLQGLQSVLSDTTQPTTGAVFILKGGRRRVIDNYEKQRSKTTDNQIHIITQGKNQCDTLM